MKLRKKTAFTAIEWKTIKRKLAKGKDKIKDVKAYRRLQALHMRGLGKSNEEIGAILDYNPKYIDELVSKFKKLGIDAIIIDKRTSNNRRMSYTEEMSFLEEFVEISEAGQIITVENILRKFEEVTGKKSHTSTIYKLLKRHGWRKVKPRPRHPGKASEEEIASSKKLTKNIKRSYWKKIEEMGETRKSSIAP